MGFPEILLLFGLNHNNPSIVFEAVVGHSEDVDSLEAAQEVIMQCRNTLGDLNPSAGIIYMGIDFEQEVILQSIREAFSDLELIGMTSWRPAKRPASRLLMTIPEKNRMPRSSPRAGRRLVLGTRVSEEYELLRTTLPADVAICGFYGYGEICPLREGAGEQSHFHNETIATLLIGAE